MDDQSLFPQCAGAKPYAVSSARKFTKFPFEQPYRLFEPAQKCIKLICCVFSLAIFEVNVTAQALAPPLRVNALVSESLHYRLLSGKVEVGKVLVDIINDNDAPFIHIVESTSGLMERTTTLLLHKDSTLSSKTSHTVLSNAALSQEVELQYEDSGVTGAMQQPARLGGTRQIQVSFLSKTQDYYIVPYLLRSCALQVNQVIKFPVYEAWRNQIELARGWVVRLEEVEVGTGKFVCYRVEGFTGRLRWILYFDQNFPHRLIKQDWPALHLGTELAEVKPNT